MKTTAILLLLGKYEMMDILSDYNKKNVKISGDSISIQIENGFVKTMTGAFLSENQIILDVKIAEPVYINFYPLPVCFKFISFGDLFKD